MFLKRTAIRYAILVSRNILSFDCLFYANVFDMTRFYRLFNFMEMC